jgi:hypothetical protein
MNKSFKLNSYAYLTKYYKHPIRQRFHKSSDASSTLVSTVGTSLLPKPSQGWRGLKKSRSRRSPARTLPPDTYNLWTSSRRRAAIELVTICLDTSHNKAHYIVIDPGEGPPFTKKGTNNKNTCQLHERSRSVVVELQPGYLLVHGSKLRRSIFFAKYLLPTTKIINREQSGPFVVAQYQKSGNEAAHLDHASHAVKCTTGLWQICFIMKCVKQCQ